MAVNFVSHGIDMEHQDTRSSEDPKQDQSKEHYPEFINKFSKVKDKMRIIKVAREDTHHIRLSVYFSEETLQARREWNIFKVLKQAKKQNKIIIL